MKTKLMKTLNTVAMFMIVMLPLLTFAVAVSAQSNADSMLWGGQESNVQNETGLGDADPRSMAASIIKILLGFLGIIAVVIILYGGFKWMTAAGNEDSVSSAKQIIGAGVIGLVIILMAFGIAQFVIDALYNATNATG